MKLEKIINIVIYSLYILAILLKMFNVIGTLELIENIIILLFLKYDLKNT